MEFWKDRRILYCMHLMACRMCSMQLPRTAYRPRTEVPSRKSTCARVPPSFPTPVRPLPVASASSGMSLPLRLLALVAVAVWPSATVEAQGTESVVAVPTSSHFCPPYSPTCGNTWTGTAEVGDPCYEACQVNSGDNPPTRWCPTTSDTSGNDGTPWGWCSQNSPSPPPPIQFQIMPSPCPSGTVYITPAEAQAHSAQICAMIGAWSIAEVGSSTLGPALSCVYGWLCQCCPEKPSLRDSIVL
eukprot:COSAG01_NODE_8496_length_2765_cov_4.228807_3_plen_243_part_00